MKSIAKSVEPQRTYSSLELARLLGKRPDTMSRRLTEAILRKELKGKIEGQGTGRRITVKGKDLLPWLQNIWNTKP